MEQIVQILGALLILAAFVLAQHGVLDTRSPAYLTLNLAGSTALAMLAARHADWGFLLLEGTWAVASLIPLVARAARSLDRRRTRRRVIGSPPCHNERTGVSSVADT
jgi:hypothetical protein